METFCKIRTLHRAIAEFEARIEQQHGLCLNEGMLLCCLFQSERLSAGQIAEQLGLTCSNASKVIRAVEDKGYVVRILGQEDHRHMYFSLSTEGRSKLKEIDCCKMEIPELLQRLL